MRATAAFRLSPVLLRPFHTRSKPLYGACPSFRQRTGRPYMKAFIETQLTRLFFALQPRAHATMSISTVETGSASLEVTRVPCLSDNYAWLLREPNSQKTAIVDPSEAAPVIAALTQKGFGLDYILNTHHHWDHTGGNAELKEKFSCTVVGPAADQDRIPGIDIPLKDGDEWQFGELNMMVYDTPGHTKGGISLHFPAAASVFTGDTLFLMGCGRLFEGTADQMWGSLSKLKSLPPETQVYCGHEYTAANARWAVTEEPDNTTLAERKTRVDELRAQGLPTVPASMAEELATNPFLRAQDAASFAALRKSKDQF